MTQEEKEMIVQKVVQEMKDYFSKHMHIDVEGYYEPYSGQDEHFHRTNIYFD